jgi:Holliday junction resolvase RusA-like endonuclease
MILVKQLGTFIVMQPRGKQRPRVVKRANMPYPIAITPDQTIDAENRVQGHVQGEWQRPPPSKPDADNYAKLVLDALNGVLWRDDSQVVRLFVEKAYCDELHPQQGVALQVHAMQIEEVG